MAGLQEQALWEDQVYQIEQTDPVVGGPPNLIQGQGITNVPHQALANRTAWLKDQVTALETAFATIDVSAEIQAAIDALIDGAPGALDTLNELAAAMGDDPNFTATILAELNTVNTPVLLAVADDAALNGVTKTSVLTAAQGVLSPPLAIGGTIEHREFSDGSAIQKAARITPAGVFLTRHIRTRRNGTWSGWTADGPDIGDLVIQTHGGALLDRLEANGAVRSRSAYADLFWRIGTTYGAGDGDATFGTPDMRGEFLRGWDNGRGVDAERMFGSWQHGSHVAHDEDDGHVHAWGRHSHAKLAGWEEPEITDNILQTFRTRDGAGLLGRTFYSAARVRNIAQMFCIQF